MHLKHRLVRTAVVATAALTVVVATLAASAAAAPQTKLVIDDPVQPNKAYDITRVVLKAQPADGDWALVRVQHGREVKVGDAIDVWFNLDDDKQPDVHVAADAFSEYHAFKTNNFLEDGKNISNRDCFRLRMVEQRSVVRFDPDCLGESTKFSVSVKSSRSDKPNRNDWVRAPGKFTKKVLSHA